MRTVIFILERMDHATRPSKERRPRAGVYPPILPLPTLENMLRPAVAVLIAIALSACIDRESTQRVIESIQVERGRPDELPAMLNRELPFRYPPALFAAKIQGNVTLRIHIDSTGAVRPESTSVVESSGYPAFDSAAVTGSAELRFSPARSHGRPIAVSLLLPVYFRHPNGQPLPGDTILHQRPTASVRP
jgi:TonB family protein